MTDGNTGNWNAVDGHGGQAPALFKEEEPETAEPSAVRSIHEARRLRQAGDVDTALAVLAGVDTAKAAPREARWAFSEWTQLVKRRFGDRDPLVYSQGTGRAAALVPTGDGGTLGGRGGPGDALAARQGRLGAQRPGAAAPEREVRDGHGQRGHPGAEGPASPGRHGGGRRGAAARSWKGPPGRLPLPRRGGGQLPRCTPTRSGSTASGAARAATCWTSFRRPRA